MKTAQHKGRLTLLVLRDAQHSVKQVQLSKPMMIAVPAAAVLSIAGLIVSSRSSPPRPLHSWSSSSR